MKKYLVLYYSPPAAMEKMQTATDEEMKAGEKDWMDWFASIGDNLVEMGEYFSEGREVNNAGVSDCTGRVTGYSMLQAENIDAAEKLLSNHPHKDWFDGCTIEFYESVDMGGSKE